MPEPTSEDPPGRDAPAPAGAPQFPLTAWFLGPRAENATIWTELFGHIFQDYVHWRRNYFPADPWLVGRLRRRSPEHESWYDLLTGQLDRILSELKFHFPLHSPRYNAHMISEQSLPAVLGYFAGLLYSPNNVTDEVAPITVSLELEVGRMIAGMIGYAPDRAWAHICSGGTLANIEALWVARAVQWSPLVLRDFCREHGVGFRIRTPDGSDQPIANLDDATLVALRPRDAVTLPRAFTRWRAAETRRPRAELVEELNQYVAASRFNVAGRGIGPVLAGTGLRPVVFASAAAHYSVVKACNVLGYGENALRLVPVNDRFQLDVDAFRDALYDLGPEEYVAAVVGIVGTTEEGAIDPIHRLLAVRRELAATRNRSFWLHADAAWGGYLRTLLQGRGPTGRDSSPEERAAACAEALDIRHRFEIDVGVDRPQPVAREVHWGGIETCAALLALGETDSTTVDPHKMGYVPYPAGVVAFRHGLVTEFVTQRAQYLSDEPEGIGALDRPTTVTAFGPHILEGSKPGAAALACWLAHRTIPLNAEGHGKIVRTTLLSARRFWCLLTSHRDLFRRLERDRVGSHPAAAPFTFFPIAEPETNLVCFVARPMEWQEEGMAPAPASLAAINLLNKRVYAAASIPGSISHQRLSAAQPFFISRTRFEERQYGGRTLRPLLERLEVSEGAYREEGLFVLRSTLMNPWHGVAEQAGMDYLLEFLRFLHRATAEAMGELATAQER